MMPALRLPWFRPRRTSPSNTRQRVGDTTCDSSIISLSEGSATIQGTGENEPCHIDTHQGPISSVNLLPDGKHVVAGGCDGTIRWWKVEESGDQASEVGERVCSEETDTAVVSRDGMWLILPGTGGRTVTVWNTSTRERVVESIEAHAHKITALDVAPDSSKIASGSRDGTVIVWCLKTGRRVAGPLSQGRSILSVKFSPVGDRLASSGSDHWIQVWSICNDGRLPATCVRADPACSLAWSNDGRSLFVGSQGGSICCFDVSSSRQVRPNWPVRPHSDSVSTLCLSNNGKFIVSASRSDCCVKIWDVRTQSEIRSLEHTSEVLDAKISPDDSYLVIGAKDGKIYIWDLGNELHMSYFFYSLTTRLTPTSYPDWHLILTEISSATYVLWQNDELATAEALLSNEIERNSSLLHYHLVNRAFIRARMQKWDEALGDAQGVIHTSELPQALLVALLAKGVALSGKKMYDTAIEALDEALENCHSIDRDFIDTIKAIILFDAGESDKAIRHVNNLVARSPDCKQPCVFVQARMYHLLAEAAMDGQQYFRAMSLFARARDLCPDEKCPELDTLSQISGWMFDGLRPAIYRRSCEACYAAGCTQELLNGICKIESTFRDDINLKSELDEWLTDLKSRSAGTLESQGDKEMRGENYKSAISLYSAALTTAPVAKQKASLFTKRSKARTALCEWEDALRDAEEAIRLNPSSPWGFERKHAALHGLARFEEAIEALKSLVSTLENSADPDIRPLRSDYVDPSDTEKAILEVFSDSNLHTPIRLLDTITGRLCDTEKRRSIFTNDPAFKKLVSSMPNNPHQEHIETVIHQYLRYVMLSHRWGAEELKLADVSNKSIYDLDASPSATKLQQFCQLARNAGVRWAWSDTCCIDKNKDVEFEKSIHSMFRWYRRSAATIVYLSDVPPRLIQGALERSDWMKRGWTLQELLAPPVIRFYYTDWTPYLNDTSSNHKQSIIIMHELEDATRVKKQDLLAFHPGTENIRVKLRLASTRETTFPEDMAYGLFGIFDVTLPVIHGESQENALGRLFQEIVACSGDVTCIAWVGRSSEFNSAFPDHLRVYEHPARTVPRIRVEDMERQVTNLRQAWTREDETQVMRFYRRLHTYPPARCTSRNLHLPCIVFHLTAFNKVKRADGVWVHRALAIALEDTDINMEGRLLSDNQGPQDFVLVCPWIYELLDATPVRHGRHHPGGDPKSLAENDSNREPEQCQHDDAFTREARCVSVTRGRDVPSDSPPDSPPPFHDLRPQQRDSESALKALELVVRFRQPLGALLLLSLGHGQFKRVATNTNITIRVRDEISLDDMQVETLVII